MRAGPGWASYCTSKAGLVMLCKTIAADYGPAGVRAMLPHVDAFLPAHNIESLVDLARTLSATPVRAPRAAA